MKTLILVLGISMATVSFAQESGEGKGPQGSQGHQGPRRPPKEAIEACSGKKTDDACEFTGRKGKVSGTCFTPDSQKPLACKPKDGPAPRGEEK